LDTQAFVINTLTTNPFHLPLSFQSLSRSLDGLQ